MLPQKKEEYYTYSDYLTWEGGERYELINGIPYAMSSPSQKHQEVSRELGGQLYNFLRGKPCKLFYAPFDVRLNADSYDDTVFQPDLLVVCDKSKLDGKSCVGAPDMVIEILSPSNSKHDMLDKMLWYRKSGVREYWLVDPDTKTVMVYIWDAPEESEKYVSTLYKDAEKIPVKILAGCEINITEVFADE